MSEPSRRSSRHKIEPLNYAEMAKAPALKGAISFLDVSAAEVRSQNFENFGPRPVISPDAKTPPGDETPPANLSTADQHLARRHRVTPITSSGTTPKTLSSSPETTPQPDKTAHNVTFTAPVSWPEDVITPGDETTAGDTSYFSQPAKAVDLTPGRGRSKIRRCVLAQDGHSLGEEAIYQALWRAGRAESASDPNSPRTIRIGAAELGYKVNMAKKNVRQNISRLFEKLALEILENFETMNSQARLYRVYSYKQILERRRAVGMEYILRNKGVVFCTQDGRELVSSPAYVSSPGDKTSIRPAPPKRARKRVAVSEPVQYEPAQTPPNPDEAESGDLQTVSKALNQYWSVDQEAAVQLLQKCRNVRSDATADEIAFFVSEKLYLARTNRNITNPVGLILATVPQSFAGSTFLELRRRRERQAAAAAEEAARKAREAEETNAWMRKEIKRYEDIAGDESRPQRERDEAAKVLRQLGE
jgi:hypothetical protein